MAVAYLATGMADGEAGLATALRAGLQQATAGGASRRRRVNSECPALQRGRRLVGVGCHPERLVRRSCGEGGSEG